jgi:thiol-disulfide isomerase/thioredoxin
MVRRSLALAALALGLSSVTVVEGEAGREGARPPAAVNVGDRLPNFEATSLTAEPFSTRTALPQHKAVVVLFLSTVCPFVNRFAPHLRELDRTYGPQGVLFVGVNSNNWEPPDEVAEHARERGFQFVMIKDIGHVIADRLDADRTPEAFLVDSEGTLRYRGWVKSKQDSPDLKRAIEAVLRGRPVTRPRTKAFGCAVDRY